MSNRLTGSFSYAGQILVCTYPLIGNYGVPDKKDVGIAKDTGRGAGRSANIPRSIHTTRRRKSLAQWLRGRGVPAITGVDTRALTKKLRRARGVMLRSTPLIKHRRNSLTPTKKICVAKVSPKQKKVYGNGKLRIVLIDCGAKENIVRSLVRARNDGYPRAPGSSRFYGRRVSRTRHFETAPGDPTQCKRNYPEYPKKPWRQKNR